MPNTVSNNSCNKTLHKNLFDPSGFFHEYVEAEDRIILTAPLHRYEGDFKTGNL